ncbi:hypothetical protein [Risungbinella massiliensis]|uniref:hypothetical protein n=1 Tax=Risungbinella massiliensis TaxID=1329796 RepID=UPI0005CC524A|nr:hypothetical protein [Risungbinella massiliensis]
MFLEYRLLTADDEEYPVLSHYKGIKLEEILLRLHCDYWVRDRNVYQLRSTSMEKECYVIYVELDEEESGEDPVYVFEQSWNGIKVEFRHFHEGQKEHPIVKEYIYTDPKDALLHLASDFYQLGETEWVKTSSEVDENRKTYIYYAEPTN